MFNWTLSTLVLGNNLLSNRLVTFIQHIQCLVEPALSGAQVFASEEHRKMCSLGPIHGIKTTDIVVWVPCSKKRAQQQIVCSVCLWDTGRWPKCGSKTKHPTTRPCQRPAHCRLPAQVPPNLMSPLKQCQDQQAHMPKRWMLSSDEKSKPLFGDQFEAYREYIEVFFEKNARNHPYLGGLNTWLWEPPILGKKTYRWGPLTVTIVLLRLNEHPFNTWTWHMNLREELLHWLSKRSKFTSVSIIFGNAFAKQNSMFVPLEAKVGWMCTDIWIKTRWHCCISGTPRKGIEGHHCMHVLCNRTSRRIVKT